MLLLLLACPPKHTGGKRVQLESFEYAWSRIEAAHYDEDMNGIDWDAVHDELEPQAKKAKTNAELRPVLEEMFTRLGDSHYGIMPIEVAEGLPGPDAGLGNGMLDLDLRLIDGEAVVSRTNESGVELGWVLSSLGGNDLAVWLAEREALTDREVAFRLNHLVRSGLTGLPVTTTWRNGADEEVSLELQWKANDGMLAEIGNLPAFYVNVRSQRVDSCWLYAFNAFFPPILDPWAEAVSDAKTGDSQGMILDLRGNPGGVSGLSVGVASYLVQEKGQVLGVMRSRDSSFNFLVTPRPGSDRFDGPVAVLIDGMSASTSEILAGGLQGIGRATVFGTNSAGMALPSTFETLPNGDRLQLVLADLVGPNGERLEGAGVAPDVVIPLTREALLTGQDPVIAAATAWVVEQYPEEEEPPEETDR